MQSLIGTKTAKHLQEAFARSSQIHMRYLYFAQQADNEGYQDISEVFRTTAVGETGHANGHLDFLAEVGDLVTGTAIGTTTDNLKAAIIYETCDHADMYPAMARTARDEGFDEIADWFETLAKALKVHGRRFQNALDTLDTLD